MMHRLVNLAILLFAAAAGCSDVTDPCDEQGCGPADLAVTRIDLMGRNAQQPVYSGDTLRIAVTIRNTGHATADSAQLSVGFRLQDHTATLNIPAFAAKETRTVEVSLVAPAIHWQEITADSIVAHVSARAPLFDPETGEFLHPDSNPANDTDAIAIAMNVAFLEIESPAEWRLLEPTVLYFRIRNPAPRAVPAQEVVWCLWDYDTCWNNTPNSRPTLEMPEIPAAGEYRFPVVMTLPFVELFQGIVRPQMDLLMRVCYPSGPNDSGAILGMACGRSDEVAVLPNFPKACPPRAAVIGVLVSGNARTDCAPLNTSYSVWSFEAQAGERFELIRSIGTVLIVDDRGAIREEEFTAPQSGTYYVLAEGPAYSFQLEKR